MFLYLAHSSSVYLIQFSKFSYFIIMTIIVINKDDRRKGKIDIFFSNTHDASS